MSLCDFQNIIFNLQLSMAYDIMEGGREGMEEDTAGERGREIEDKGRREGEKEGE